jgi:hypothetical protein
MVYPFDKKNLRSKGGFANLKILWVIVLPVSAGWRNSTISSDGDGFCLDGAECVLPNVFNLFR